MRNAFIKELTSQAQRNKNIILLTGDLGFTVFENFQVTFPKRFYNMGVAEAHMMGVASGMALSHLKPIVYSIATFASMRGFEQIRNDICLHNADVKIIGSGAGLSYGHAGSTHHSLEDIALMRSLPNMTVIAPSDSYSCAVLTSAIIASRGPVYFRLGKKGEPKVYKKRTKLQIGKGVVLKEGKDAAIIATGNMVHNALIAGEILSHKHIACEIIDMHTIKPIDRKLIRSILTQIPVVITLEEHHTIGGLGSAISEIIAECDNKHHPQKFKMLGIPDTFVKEVGSQEYLRKLYGLTPPQIAKYIQQTYKS